jgi:hypothetical protein
MKPFSLFENLPLYSLLLISFAGIPLFSYWFNKEALPGKDNLLYSTSAKVSEPAIKLSSGESMMPAASLQQLAKDFVFEDERPFAQCHASTLVRTDDGNFLIAWFGGTHEKHSDVGIWLSKGNPGKWSAPVEIAKIREDAHWNPVLFNKPDGTIILYFKVGATIDLWETWLLLHQIREKPGQKPKNWCQAIKAAEDL